MTSSNYFSSIKIIIRSLRCNKWIKEKTGYSYYELLTHIKLQKSKQLLLNTTLSISQISKQLSYKNPESFIRTFKKYEAITPQAYRKNEQ